MKFRNRIKYSALLAAPLLAFAAPVQIAANENPSATAQQAMKRLLVARARIVGALLTKYDAKSAGYGYHYNYDGYYAYGNTPRLSKG